MKKKKTLHAIVKYFYPVIAGIETNMLETYSVMVQNGWNITIHTSSNTHTENGVLKPVERIRNLFIKRYTWSLFGFWPEIEWDHTDVVAIHNFNVFPHVFLFLYAWARKLVGKTKPVIMLTPHGGFTTDWQIFHPFIASIKKFYHYTIGTFLINASVDVLRAVSEWERVEVIKRGIVPSKVTTISNGIEDEAFMNVDKKASLGIKNRVKSYGKYLVQIGRIYGIKNYETTIHALTRLSQDINFVIVGSVQDQKYLEYLKKYAQDMGVEKRVHFAGVVRGVDKYYLIRHAQIMVHMARWESFCNAVHEGMSQGLPCVVANNTALPLLIKNDLNGYCIDTYDWQTLATKIGYILENKNSLKVQKIMKKNQSFGLSHSWRAVAQQCASVLNAVLSRPIEAERRVHTLKNSKQISL